MDDTEELRTLFTLLLEYLGYCVVAAEHGAAALAYLHACAELPALVLLDLEMPVMDGWTFRQAQQRDLRFAAIPVIVVSAEPDVERIAALAPAGYLRKPFDVAALQRLIAHVLRREP